MIWQRQNNNKKLQQDVQQQKQQPNVCELSVLSTLLFSGPTASAGCRCREESFSKRHCICLNDLLDVPDYSMYSKLSVCVDRPRSWGQQWGKNQRKIPLKKQKQCRWSTL
jgi:hypothetical protein